MQKRRYRCCTVIAKIWFSVLRRWTILISFILANNYAAMRSLYHLIDRAIEFFATANPSMLFCSLIIKVLPFKTLGILSGGKPISNTEPILSRSSVFFSFFKYQNSLDQQLLLSKLLVLGFRFLNVGFSFYFGCGQGCFAFSLWKCSFLCNVQ